MDDEEFREFDSCFHPRTIAIVGATDNPFSGGSGFLNALIAAGFPKIFPINKTKTSLFGIPAFPNLRAVPEPIDYVIIAVPKNSVLAVVKECVGLKIKLGTIFTSGFRELGDTALENEIVKTAREGGMRLLGPNCIGLYIPKEYVSFIVNLPVGLESSGNIGIISQSGGHADMFSFLGSSRGLKFSKVISYGNGCDINNPELLEYFERDTETNIIFMYLEGFKNAEMGQRFCRIAAKVIKEKPLILWKGGRTQAGKEAIKSHTGALAGSNDVLEGVIRQLGLIEVTNPEEAIDVMTAFYYLLDKLPIGRRIGVVGGGGGNTVASADILSRYGFELPVLQKEVRQRITEIIGEVGVIVRNPIDLNVSIWEQQKVRKVLQIMREQPFDMLLFDCGIDWGLHFEKAFGMTDIMKENILSILRVLKKVEIPLVAVFPTVFYEGEILSQKITFEQMFQKQGIPVFPTVQRCAFALNNLMEYGERFREERNLIK
ncbi:MAG: CoA-binding protein [Candidatus Helarchaeota archaeon]